MDPPDSTTRAQLARPARWLEEHGDYLYACALARAGKSEVAEDLVQETLLAGLQAWAKFGGKSSERTWLVGILKHKWFDRLRREARSRPFSDLCGPDDWLDGLYDSTGHWKVSPGAWGKDPAQLCEKREFWQTFEHCRQALPERMQAVLTLRLIDRAPTEAVCEALEISSDNLFTLLHRARLRLWKCLDGKGHGPASRGRET